MEAFEIKLAGETYKIQPLDDGSCQVYFSHTLYGEITPNLNDNGVVWESDSINRNLAQQIGELIEEHDM